ncbi:hypothetical protein KIPB_006937 [Kipferlia bialata]|uniref:EGF-like domain-containing protein n=1 Tax=Kipferlia bialata TaxID=797122 RepID=A0A9K3CZK5_9EUKA|nr:hypothetical protein KIPB_006937 [Kipferlia bialata]|eukprot:g6937.t1
MSDTLECGSYGTLTDGVCECVLGWGGTLCDENEIYSTVMEHVLTAWWFWAIFGACLVLTMGIMKQLCKGRSEDVVPASTVVSLVIIVCCFLNAILLGWEHMIAASRWDWGLVIVLVAEGVLIVPMLLYAKTALKLNLLRYSKPSYMLRHMFGGAVIHLLECTIRFLALWVSLSRQYLYHEAPRSTHMFYGPYLVAALGSGVLCLGWLGWGVWGGLLQKYPWGPNSTLAHNVSFKRTQYFNEHGVPREQGVGVGANAIDPPPVLEGGRDMANDMDDVPFEPTLPKTGCNTAPSDSDAEGVCMDGVAGQMTIEQIPSVNLSEDTISEDTLSPEDLGCIGVE